MTAIRGFLTGISSNSDTVISTDIQAVKKPTGQKSSLCTSGISYTSEDRTGGSGGDQWRVQRSGSQLVCEAVETACDELTACPSSASRVGDPFTPIDSEPEPTLAGREQHIYRDRYTKRPMFLQKTRLLR